MLRPRLTNLHYATPDATSACVIKAGGASTGFQNKIQSASTTAFAPNFKSASVSYLPQYPNEKSLPSNIRLSPYPTSTILSKTPSQSIPNPSFSPLLPPIIPSLFLPSCRRAWRRRSRALHSSRRRLIPAFSSRDTRPASKTPVH